MTQFLQTLRQLEARISNLESGMLSSSSFKTVPNFKAQVDQVATEFHGPAYKYEIYSFSFVDSPNGGVGFPEGTSVSSLPPGSSPGDYILDPKAVEVFYIPSSKEEGETLFEPGRPDIYPYMLEVLAHAPIKNKEQFLSYVSASHEPKIKTILGL